MKPTLSYIVPLTQDQRELVERLTGESYYYGSSCGIPFDDKICFSREERIVVLKKNHIVPGIDPSEKIEIIRNGVPTSAYTDASDKLRIDNLFRDMDSVGFSLGVVPRLESRDMREWRMAWLDSLVGQLTPELADGIHLIDLRRAHVLEFALSDADGVTALRYGWIRIVSNDLAFDRIFFHEAAHTLTSRLENTDIELCWKDIAGNIYVGQRWKDVLNGKNALEQMMRLGVVSRYSLKGWMEDISELTAHVYTKPGYVRFMAARSPILCAKLQCLCDHHYISDEQYEEVMDQSANDAFLAQWEGSAAETYGPFDQKKRELTRRGFVARGFVDALATESPSQDIAITLGAIAYSPMWVRNAVTDSPIFANRIGLLYEQKLITEAEYRYVMSVDGDAISARPENDPLPCSIITDTWATAAACYISRSPNEIAECASMFAKGFETSGASAATFVQTY